MYIAQDMKNLYHGMEILPFLYMVHIKTEVVGIHIVRIKSWILGCNIAFATSARSLFKKCELYSHIREA